LPVDKNALEAPCGLHCGFCPLNRAVTDEQLKKRISERLKLPIQKAACPGCRPVDGYCPVIGEEQCSTWLCAKGKGVEFCSECTEFPCVKLLPCSDRSDQIPQNIKICSLALRKAKGAHEWEKAIKEIYDLYFQGKMVVGHGPRKKTV
jgi:hypothetical protein